MVQGLVSGDEGQFRDAWRRARWIDGLALAWLSTLVVGALFASWLPFADPNAIDPSAALAVPSAAHWLGTDPLGRDVLSRVVYGARYSLPVVGGATALGMGLGAVFGLLSGYRGGRLQRSIDTVIDALWTVPPGIFAILALTVTEPTPFTLIMVLTLVNWVVPARVIAAATERCRRSDYVRRARAMGLSEAQILFREVAPVLRPTMLGTVLTVAIDAMTAESGLAFLGLTLPPPAPTWGGMLSEALEYLSSALHLALVPAVAILITILSLSRASRLWSNAR